MACIKCGECCRSLNLTDTVCEYLTDNNLCRIYNTRPGVCRPPRLYGLYDRREFNIAKLKACVLINKRHNKLENVQKLKELLLKECSYLYTEDECNADLEQLQNASPMLC
jgi:protein-tyrosine phosphatase